MAKDQTKKKNETIRAQAEAIRSQAEAIRAMAEAIAAMKAAGTRRGAAPAAMVLPAAVSEASPTPLSETRSVPPVSYDADQDDRIDIHYETRRENGIETHWQIVTLPNGHQGLSEPVSSTNPESHDNDNSLRVSEGKTYPLVIASKHDGSTPCTLTLFGRQESLVHDGSGSVAVVETPKERLPSGAAKQFTFSLPHPVAEGVPELAKFLFRPAADDHLQLTATGDDPRFTIKFKT